MVNYFVFQGIACEEKWTYETKRLAEVLSHTEDIRTDFYITATYDSPFQLVSDRNEIWFVKLDRKKAIEQAEGRVLKYGSQKVEVPTIFSWLLCLVLAYLSFLVTLGKTAINTFSIVQNNWDGVRTRLQLVTWTLWHSVSLRTLARTGISVMLTMWSLALSIITGFFQNMPRKTQWPKRIKASNRKYWTQNGYIENNKVSWYLCRSVGLFCFRKHHATELNVFEQNVE